jgi:hypothetical protein
MSMKRREIPIFPNLLDNNTIQTGTDITIQVYIPLKLIQKLTPHGININHSPGTRMLRNNARSVSIDFRNGKPRLNKGINGVPVKAREITASNVRRAFNQMTGNQSSSETVVVSF